MKKLSLIFLLLALMSSFSFAQTQEKPQAFKFDEFQDLPETDWKQKLDRFTEMQISFPDSYLEIIVYAQTGTHRTSINDLKKEYKNYLSKVKKAESTSVISGGFRKSQTTELWVVPKGASFPVVAPDEKFKPEIFAEFGVLDDEVLLKKLEEYDIKLIEEYLPQGYIINYGNPREVAERERKIRDNDLRRCDIGGPRIVFVNGGKSGTLKTVLWIVPYGAEPPTP